MRYASKGNGKAWKREETEKLSKEEKGKRRERRGKETE